MTKCFKSFVAVKYPKQCTLLVQLTKQYWAQKCRLPGGETVLLFKPTLSTLYLKGSSHDRLLLKREFTRAIFEIQLIAFYRI